MIRTLGSGAHSKVKLAKNSTDNNFYAVKILKKDNPHLDKKLLDLVVTEVNTMKELKHDNIVNLVEYNEKATVQKSNGASYEALIIILELAQGGELFDYVATGGRFPDVISRFYFKQLIDGLEYVHGMGLAHRDLKPENLLFDQHFNLKVADFGFAAPLAGRDGSGYLKTRLGTESYMAPEIHQRQPYNGSTVDLFAAAIILFIMYAQHPPFNKADPNDPFYRLICANRPELFWKAHSRNKPGGEAFFPEEFKNLITQMLQYDPTHRLSLAEVKSHPWVTGQSVTLADIQGEFGKRKALIDKEAEAKRIEEEQKKQFQASQVGNRRVYRSDGGEEKPGFLDVELEKERQVEEYIPVVSKNTEFFSSYDPTTLVKVLHAFANSQASQFNLDDGVYKAKMSFVTETDKVDATVRILKCPDNKYCVDFTRKEGDALEFYNVFNNAK